MSSHTLDPFRPHHSVIHGLDPRIKTVFVLVYVLSLALIPPGAWPLYILFFSVALAVALLSELGLGYLVKRSLLALPFALAALPLLFTIPGEPLAHFTLGPLGLALSREGTERFAGIVAKALLSILMAVTLTGTTAFPALLVALRWLRIPKLLVSIVSLAWRYIFVFSDEATRLLRARASRSGNADPSRRPGGALAWRAKVTGAMAGNLLLRGFSRAERIYAAMLARGYDGEARALAASALTPAERLVLGLSAAPLIILALLGMLLWG